MCSAAGHKGVYVKVWFLCILIIIFLLRYEFDFICPFVCSMLFYYYSFCYFFGVTINDKIVERIVSFVVVCHHLSDK